MNNKNRIVIFEMILIVSLSFSFSYILKESLGFKNYNEVVNDEEIGLIGIYEKIINFIFSEENIVSALESVGTCLESKDGSICQEYLTNECDEKCSSNCLPARSKDVAECRLGVCYSPDLGICQDKATKQACESGKGEWFDDEYGNIAQCKQGCCLLQNGNNAIFTTERSCFSQAEQLGISKTNVDFRAEITNQFSCLILASNQEQGACVFTTEIIGEKNDCKFGTRGECLQSNGEFYSGLLCSNPELNTKCESQKSTSCVEGKDEVYWFDSCGNRENIYSANKGQSFNDGKVLGKAESCELGTENNLLKNQDICGNCAYIDGSVCGAKTNNEKLSDSKQDFVCRDLRCVDIDGETKENGESWCKYQGDIGVDESVKGFRSVDTPGSRHFRLTCLDGEIRTDACADYRNEICVENQADKLGGGTISSAACKINPWQQCLQYNNEVTKDKKSLEKRDDLCEKNPSCFIKEVNVDKYFKFNICAPKYPPGFNLRTNAEAAEGLCALATQKCTVIYVKKISGWECKANCDCEESGFAQQMNDLCMSIGDCGASVNFNGELTENYNVKKSPKLGKNYLSSISKYSETVEGKYADISQFIGESGEFLGIPDDLGKPPKINSKVTLGVAGMMGIGFLVLTKTQIGKDIASSLGFDKLSNLFGGGAPAATPAPLAGGLTGPSGAVAGPATDLAAQAGTPVANAATQTGGLAPSLSGILNVVTAALAFYSVYSMFKTAIDLDDPIAIAIVAVAVVATAYFTGAFAGESLLASFFPGLGIAMLVVMGIFMLLGLGKSKKVVVTFECQPWQAPFGGKSCSECGKDGFPCSQYACQSLGQTCELINANSDEASCIDISPNDVTSPIIKPLQSVLSDNYEYNSINENGVKIERIDGTNEGCVAANEELVFGIELNEPGQCRFDVEHTENYDEMSYDFGNRNLLLMNHTHLYTIPSLESLGLPGFDPEKKTEQNLYVRCKDASGNINEKEYAINFCVRPGKDLTAPIVTGRIPRNEWVDTIKTELNISVFTNEPAECKYSLQNKNYESMENSFDCANDVEDRVLLGWECSSNINIAEMKGVENKIYARCKDQPWLIEDSGDGKSIIRIDEGDGNFREIKLSEKRQRNTNTESYEFIIKRSQSVLNIEAVKPLENEKIISGVEPVSVDIIVKTSGGVNGNALCSYIIGSNKIQFFQTGEKEHKQKFEEYLAGAKSLPVVCEDEAGNSAEETLRFSIELDTQSPKITRVYNTGGILNIITDEDSQCAYKIGENKKNLCSFGFTDSDVIIMNGDKKVHTGNFDNKETYYIKCKDKFDNKLGTCNIIVKQGV